MVLATCLSLALAWAPESAREHRSEVCRAIVAATHSDLEHRWLLVVAVEESHGLAPRSLDCRARGDRGRARGAWQVHARSARERRELCTVATAAPIALERIRESEHACRHQKPSWRHAAYAAGSCTSRGGQRVSASRWARVAASFEETGS